MKNNSIDGEVSQIAPEENDYSIITLQKECSPRNVLVADLDGTLIHTDLLHESVLSYIKTNIFSICYIIFWLLKGKAYLKQKIATKVSLATETLPYNEKVLAFLRKEKNNGRYLVLASASTAVFVNAVAKHLGLFDEVLSSKDKNLSSHNKSEILQRRFGVDNFDYIGNSKDDIPVWNAARHSLIAAPSFHGAEKLSRSIRKKSVEFIITEHPANIWKHALHIHQWYKNILVFIPLLASHKIIELPLLSQAIASFMAFNFCASAIYIVNDIFDLQEDRKHAKKSQRPFAKGVLEISQGITAALLLILASVIITLLINAPQLLCILGIYLIISLGYSVWLKQILMADIVTLACLYTLRIIAGAAATDIQLSMWLLGFSVFLFCGLAFSKRAGDFARNDAGNNIGRGYHSEDAPAITALGIGSSLISLLLLTLYIYTPTTVQMYKNTEILWGLIPLMLYLIGRIWILTLRGQVQEDPVLFVLKDKPSLWCAIFGISTILLAL